MTIIWGDTGKVSYGSYKTFNFQCATPREVSLGVVTLPTVEGSTNQASFTVQQSDLPTVTPNAVSMKYVACIVTSGKAVTAATINYKILKNSSTVVTSSSSVSANQFYSHNHWRWFDVSVGDLLEVRLWSSQADSNLDYACLVINPANVMLSKMNTILKDVTYTLGTTTNNPNPTGAGVRPIMINSTSGGFLPINNQTAIGSSIGVFNINVTGGTPPVFPYLTTNSTGTFRVSNGGDTTATTTNALTNATNIVIQKNGIPTTLSFREILR